MSVAIIYHKNCIDGTMSAFLMGMYLENKGISNSEIDYYPMHYGDKLPEFKSTCNHVYVVDFSLSVEDLNSINAKAINYNIYDHHESANELYKSYPHSKIDYDSLDPKDGSVSKHQYSKYIIHKGSQIKIYKNNSGCGIILNMIRMDKAGIDCFISLPESLVYMVKLIEDRDLWRFKYLQSKYANILMKDIPLEQYKNMFYNEFPLYKNIVDKLDIVKLIYDYNIARANSIAKKATVVKFQGHNIPMVNCINEISEVGNILASNESNTSKRSLSYFISNGEYPEVICSMRSIIQEYPVNDICAKFGGGGHPCAAGFKLPLDKLGDLLSGKL